MYAIPEPPYVLMIGGLFFSLASGVAFESVLKKSVQDWSKNRSTRTLATLQGIQLFLPFLGISLGMCLFLSSGMEVFGFTTQLSYAIALPLTVLIGWLIWSQLGKILAQLESGGSQALDLDSWG